MLVSYLAAFCASSLAFGLSSFKLGAVVPFLRIAFFLFLPALAIAIARLTFNFLVGEAILISSSYA